ncbi:hypothetical protein FHW84_003985 [Dyella sp. SG562]|uniref:hypothetical protein n=1 Tax=Dyella sp. SG562 TaxID=2587017 RepID=UPI00141FE7D3|nr:hypothetical protein [Dyella sp. SG562]NII75376.1 hypothetical protein [Dyella sp. SG562]
MADGADEGIDFSKTLLGNDPVGPLAKLLWECSVIHTAADVEPIVRMFMSHNAASTAWHLTDWTWKRCPADKRPALTAAVGAKGESFAEYAYAVRHASKEVAVCRQLATAGKHVTVSRGEMKNLSVEVERDDEAGTSQVWLKIDEVRIPDFDVYAVALRWWIDLYIQIGFPEAERVKAALDEGLQS